MAARHKRRHNLITFSIWEYFNKTSCPPHFFHGIFCPEKARLRSFSGGGCRKNPSTETPGILPARARNASSGITQAAVDKAAENTTVDMPKALVENELDIQMERFGYQLQMSGYSMEQYAKMMGGDVSTMRNAFRPAAEKQAKISVTLEKIAEVEGITASDEDIEAEFKSLAEQYELEVDKVKEMVPMDELTGSIKTRKAIKVIVDSAVPVAPKAEEKTEE